MLKITIAVEIFYRLLDGVADACAWNSIVSLLMVIFPNKAAFIVASTETVFGVGMSIGDINCSHSEVLSSQI